MLEKTFPRRQHLVLRRYRLWTTSILGTISILYLVAWSLDLSLIWPMLSFLYAVVALLCWRGSNRSFAIAFSLACIGLIGDILFFLLNVLGFFSPAIVAPALVLYALLQLPVAYASLRVYNGSLRWPVLLILIGSLLLASSYLENVTRGYLAPAIDISKPQLTTLSEILAGKFHSALDKYGLNGTLVEVVNVTVIQFAGALDGDWHIVVQDAKVSRPFITEILPRDQVRLKAPAIGQHITIMGIVYWDDAHMNEAWHGYTGWEIHPILAWSAIS